MGSKHKQYDETFKREAVRLWQSSGKAAGAIEDELGISRGLLYKWRRKIETVGGEAFPGRGHQNETEGELRRLRQENEILRQERDILKKAVVIFSTPPR
jgi:transposase